MADGGTAKTAKSEAPQGREKTHIATGGAGAQAGANPPPGPQAQNNISVFSSSPKAEKKSKSMEVANIKVVSF